MATATETAAPTLAGMNYRVVGSLGNGAGSTVLEIADKNDRGKRYALKVVRKLDADDAIYIDQAKTEFEAAQKLNHSAIARIYDFRLKKSWFRVVGAELLMEKVDGRTLDEIEAPELGQLVLMFTQAAAALAHMHRRGVYHGDMKPSNIMLSKSGEVKLIDFGTAWIRGEEKNRVQGTPQYIAPEQAAERVVNDKTDIYNFGATMYRMFTGRYAQTAIPGPGVDRKLPAPSKVNPRIVSTLNNLILSCLEVSPANRPETMVDVREQLVKVVKEMGLRGAELKGAEDDEEF